MLRANARSAHARLERKVSAMTAVADDSTSTLPHNPEKAQRFFDRARSVAEASQWDYAIEMYLQGLAHDPDNVEMHAQLRKVAMTRRATDKKAKGLGMFESSKLKKRTKDDLQNFLNARKLLSYDPGNAQYLDLLSKTAAKIGARQTVVWVGPMLFRALLDAPKQDANAFVQLKETYKQVGEFKLAADALSQAAAIRPDDSDLTHELRELAARETMREGGYDKKGGDFRGSLKDAEGQKRLLEQDADVRTEDAMQGRIRQARQEYEAEPEVAGKLAKLVEVLVKTGDLKRENEALDLLEREFARTKNVRWKLAADKIKIDQFARGERMLRQMARDNPGDEATKRELGEFRREKAQMEMEYYREGAKAYPTDMRWKFEAAKRMFELGEFTEAIPQLQQAQNDAKTRDEARLLLGRAFLHADFADEAADTLRNLIESYQGNGDDRSKEMHYWFARASEEKGDPDEAVRAYSQIAQWDFGYRDVQTRIKDLRAKK